MKVKMLKTAADANATYVAGGSYEIAEKEARILIEAGAAEVAPTKPSKRQRQAPVETADARGSEDVRDAAAKLEKDAEGQPEGKAD